MTAPSSGQTVLDRAHVGQDGRERGADALAVADAWRRRGVGRRLLHSLLDCARRDRLRSLDGVVLAWNQAMPGFVEQAGFRVRAHPEDERLLRVELAL